LRGKQLGGGRGAAVAGESGRAIAGERSDDAGRLDDLADAIVGGVGDVDVAAGVHGHSVGVGQPGGGCGAAVAGGAVAAVASDGGDDGGGFHHFADGSVVGVGDVDVDARVEGHAVGVIECGGGRGAAVAGVAVVAVASDGDDVAGCLHHFANAIVVGVGDVDVAAGVHGHPGRVSQHGGGGGAVI